MQIPALLKTKAFLIAAGAALAIIVLVWLHGYAKGAANCELKQAQEQLKQETKVRKDYEKIDRAAPSDADDAGVAGFLLKRATH
jgi:hypothetical protein